MADDKNAARFPVYESRSKRAIITRVGAVPIRFTPNEVTRFGELDLNSPALLKATNLTAEKLQEKIEGNPNYTERLVGIHGFWRQEERMSKVVTEAQGSIRAALQQLPDDQLRATVTRAGVKVPVTATHDELVELAFTAMMGSAAPEIDDGVKKGGLKAGLASVGK